MYNLRKVQKWQLTDDDCMQYRRQVDHASFQFIQLNACGEDSKMYGVSSDVIDVGQRLIDDPESVLSTLHSFGYKSVEEIQAAYLPSNATAIIAECLFEMDSQTDRESAFAGTRRDCTDYIRNVRTSPVERNRPAQEVQFLAECDIMGLISINEDGTCRLISTINPDAEEPLQGEAYSSHWSLPIEDAAAAFKRDGFWDTWMGLDCISNGCIDLDDNLSTQEACGLMGYGEYPFLRGDSTTIANTIIHLSPGTYLCCVQTTETTN